MDENDFIPTESDLDDLWDALDPVEQYNYDPEGNWTEFTSQEKINILEKAGFDVEKLASDNLTPDDVNDILAEETL